MEKDLVGAVVGPGADKAGVFAVAEPVRDLFDGGLFQIVRQCGLAGGGSVRCAVFDPAPMSYFFVRPSQLSTLNPQLTRALLGPAVGFGGFKFEFRDGFYRITGWQDFGVGGFKFVGGGGGAGEGAVRFFVEAIGDGLDGAGEDAVVVGDGEGEAGFDGGELGEHEAGWLTELIGSI